LKKSFVCKKIYIFNKTERKEKNKHMKVNFWARRPSSETLLWNKIENNDQNIWMKMILNSWNISGLYNHFCHGCQWHLERKQWIPFA
jgi:hypothetical protein